jgi:hypothetical protein
VRGIVLATVAVAIAELALIVATAKVMATSVVIATAPAIAIAAIPAIVLAVAVRGLAIMRLAVDIAAQTVLCAINAGALVPGHRAVRPGAAFHTLNLSAFALQPLGFARRELAGLNAAVDARLLAPVALFNGVVGLRERGACEQGSDGNGYCRLV